MMQDILIVGSGLVLGIWFLVIGIRAAWLEFSLRRMRRLYRALGVRL